MSALVLRRDDRLACRRWIAAHSRSFYVSSLLLPARVRSAAWALYAFCRRADDAVDEGAREGARRRVDALRRRLDEVYAGRPADHAVDRAFAAVVESVDLPRALPEALFDGMELDAGVVRFADHDALLGYCFRVAATVGLMMTRVMGVAHPVGWLRAADLGVAMQLTNIARDVGEDAARGRLYLPLSLCDEVGLDAEGFVRAPTRTPPLRAAVRALLTRAASHYRAADRGIALLPASCRVAIRASRLIYAAIGDRVAAHGYDSVSQRAQVSTSAKLALVARALPSLFWRADTDSRGPADALLAPLIAACGLPLPEAAPALAAAPTAATEPRT